MTIQLKIGANHINVSPEDVLLGESQVALLADVEQAVTIAPHSHARIATTVAFTGDGNTIALIDMHCGKLAHALGKVDDAIVAKGEYFLPAIDEHVDVHVDVINETGAIMIIRPKNRLGILTFVNINSEASDPQVLSNDDGASVIAEFNPQHLDPADRPAYAHSASNGVGLKADIAKDLSIPPGATMFIPTGLTISLPEGLETQVRAEQQIHNSLLIQSIPAISAGQRQAVVLVITNAGAKAQTIRPGECLAQMAFTPVIRATLKFATAEEKQNSSSANVAQ